MAAPRAFISYARKDGEAFATALRARLEKEEPEITLWQDRARMEGGVGWWKQITEALDQVTFMVLVVTPGSLESDVVQKEWRYARQQGVCIYPVNAAEGGALDFARMPKWMSSAHFYSLDREWQTFVNHLKSPCQAARVPFMAPDLPVHGVERPALLGQLLARVLGAGRENPVATKLAIHGSGGFGKTTLAAQLCHHEDVVTAFIDGVLWVTLGERPNALAELTKLYAALTGERPEFVSEEDAALSVSRRLGDRRCLIVIDDVWDPAALGPFLRGAPECARLVTTRQFDVALSLGGETLPVGEMTEREATALFARHLDGASIDARRLQPLVARVGEWPLLLELAGAALRQRLARGDSLDGALAYVDKALDRHGITAFDRRNAQDRNQAVAKTLAVSLDLLSSEERERFRALAVFPEDVSVPLGAAGTLLELDDFDTEQALQTLADLSLVALDLKTGTLRMHDVMRAYLAADQKDAPRLHARLADAWNAPERLRDEYAYRYVVYHMTEALEGTSDEERHVRSLRLVDLVTSVAFHERYLRTVADPPALRRDLDRALAAAATDAHPEGAVSVVRVALVRAAHIELDPNQLFELAREGMLEKAESLLDLFEPDSHWRSATLLTLAWQAAVAGRDEATKLLATLGEHAPDAGPLGTLYRYARFVAGEGGALPAPDLPAAPDAFMISQILHRLGGTALTPIEPLMISGLEHMGDEAVSYLAERDGPLLVAYARQDPQHNAEPLRQYIAAQASNRYPFYRNRSLWALLPSVLQCDAPGLTLELVRDVVSGVLKPTRMDFRSALPLAIQALQALNGDVAARLALDADRDATLERVRNLSPERGEGDPWAHALRRLAALAEIYTRLLGAPDEGQRLLDAATGIGFESEFAGFRSPACLTTAESLRVCGAPRPRIDAMLDAAESAAHNVQDAEFCAQSSARVHALRARWWPVPPDTFDVAKVVERFVADPGAREFLPVHRVGDQYEKRAEVATRLPLPPHMKTARTLRDVAALYPSMRGLSDDELLALNTHLVLPAAAPLDHPFDDGALVSVLDPDFAAVLAARFAAELSAEEPVSSERRVLIQRLVPLAVADPTLLDTVLARLLMAAPMVSPPLLSALAREVSATARGA